MLEILAAITIVGLVLAVSVPASARLYQSMQYRQAVRDVVTLFASARYQAVNTGRAQDVVINPRAKELRLNDTLKRLPADLNVLVHSARELNDRDAGIIRFYPEGGSSGGGVDIEVPDRWGVRVNVDWLIGRVSQEKYAFD
ncbi:MAG: general secretion pathway protein GspH [Haliea sp.]|jgi:general secretion pathway protein H|nr:general secretion pathway protein GspH [Haliea sp.]